MFWVNIERANAIYNIFRLPSIACRSLAVVCLLGLQYGDIYPSVKEDQVAKDLMAEEEKFLQTLDRGLKEVQKFVDHLGSQRMDVADVAHQAFDFYQTFGLPVDIFIDELIQRGGYEYSIDERLEIQDLAQAEFAKHQELSRQGSVGMFKGGLGSHGDKEIQYHTTTHLLQQALRDVLGDTVIQRGSNITPERLRFDFTSENRLTDDQKRKVEEIVNEKIAEHLPVSFTVLPIAEAEKTGAIHAFGEKYGDAVKVYSIGGVADGKTARRRDGEDNDPPTSNLQPSADERDQKPETRDLDGGIKLAQGSGTIAPRSEVYSREFCGGPHVANTSEIKGTFKIQKDEKIARDVVRIKAVLE